MGYRDGSVREECLVSCGSQSNDKLYTMYPRNSLHLRYKTCGLMLLGKIILFSLLSC
jgi:hypothetical protein